MIVCLPAEQQFFPAFVQNDHYQNNHQYHHTSDSSIPCSGDAGDIDRDPVYLF